MVLGDGNCTDKHYICSSDGLFRIYPEENCVGSSLDFILTTDRTEFTSTEIGDFIGFMNSFDSGTQKVEWVAYTPSSFVIPLHPPNNRFIAWDIFALVQYAIALICYLGSGLYGIIRYYQTPKRFLVYLTINQMLWFIQQWIEFYIYITVFEEYDDYNLVMAIYKPLWAFTTLSTVVLTTYQLYSSPFIPQKTKPFVYSFVVLLHLLVSGSDYFEWCYFTSYSDWTLCSSVYLENWRNAHYWWIVIMFVWNIIPTTLVAFVIINTTKVVQTKGFGSYVVSTIRILTQSHKLFVFILIGQVLLMVLYLVWSNILIYYQILGSDKAYLAFGTSMSLFCAFHIVMNLRLLQCLPTIFKMASNSNTESIPKSTMSQQVKKI
ncbi:hypothetical protein BC833DRAFT_611246 [Globomyces pollinis-pini]|nr:hypothetical protein BC833DRAFT_611246 [Globomyces pollinis-pini]